MWLEKTNRLTPSELSGQPAVHWGHVLEPVILQEYERVTGTTVTVNGDTHYHTDYPFILAHLDGEIVGEKKIIECKTANMFMRDQWGEPSSDQVPNHYLIQVQHYMAVMNYNSADIAVLIGGQDFWIYTVHRDDALIAALLAQLNHFWQEHVLADSPPAPSNKGSASRLWPRETMKSITANGNDLNIIRHLHAIKSRQKKLTTQKEKLESEIVNRIGSAASLTFDNHCIATWRANKNGSRVLRTYPMKSEQKEQPQQWAAA